VFGDRKDSHLTSSRVTAITSIIKPSEIRLEEIAALARLVNAAYHKGEEGICLPNVERTSENAITQMIQRDELIGLRVGRSWKGCVHVGSSPYDSANKSALFGMLAVAGGSQYRGHGYGTLLVQSAEILAKKRGYVRMMLELLKPLNWKQAHKERLENWYIKRGYLHIDTPPFHRPEILMLKECIFKIFQKNL
jgi:GNAT superfamily N-acetyltransferase